ncbi:hypothetical protein EYC80_010354 [Monilinia laxa]|uniref:ACB domain-containing protein n=1 Tax=Monilinia laxa TaxID=61186 RepID=A0A5N6JP51_MONLA|nr:hypothetical protein EYC80_010354 [Monilinia laxa]
MKNKEFGQSWWAIVMRITLFQVALVCPVKRICSESSSLRLVPPTKQSKAPLTPLNPIPSHPLLLLLHSTLFHNLHSQTTTSTYSNHIKVETQQTRKSSLTMSAFDTAVLDSKKLTSKPGSDDLLEIYSLYKVAIGDDISKAETPGMFDIKGKAKKKAWQEKVDSGITADEAKEKYVAKIAELKEKYGYDADKVPEAVGGN